MRRTEDIQHDMGRALLLIRGGRSASRSEISAQLSIAAATAGEHVARLIDHGYLRETGVEKNGPGRPKRSLALRAEAGWFAGVEFNAERVQAVRLDFAGRVADADVRPLPAQVTTLTILREMARSIERLKRGATGPLLAAGIGAAGIVDPDAGLGVEYAMVPDWRDVPVVAEFTRRLRVPVTLEHNLRAIAYAERWLGGGRDLDDYVILGPRSGFAVAIVSGGRVITGAHHAAGEVGYWSAGGTDLHDVLSAPAIWRRLASAPPKKRPPADLARAVTTAAASNPRQLAAVVADFADVIGRLHVLLDSQAYFLHGPLTALDDGFCASIVEHARKRTPALDRRPPVIQRSTLGDNAGAIGVACRAMEVWTPATASRRSPA
jgi:predicted NBD/HSP70 family sugar kinase